MADVFVNGRFLTQRVTGVQRYGRELLRALGSATSPLAASDHLHVLVPRDVDGGWGDRVTVRTVPASAGFQGYVWEQVTLRRNVPRGAHLLSLANTGPLVRSSHVMVVHDAAVFDVPNAFSRKFRVAFRALLRAHAKRGTRIATVSNASRTRLARHLSLPEEAIAVVPEGVDHVARVTPDAHALERLGLTERSYVLGVSTQELRKNFALIERLAPRLAREGLDVVIAGGANHRVFGAAATSGSVRHVGFVTDEMLVALYRGAACFVHPSSYEGFGLTPLEAMMAGSPVVASDLPVLRETLGDAAAFADPHDDEAFFGAIMRVVTDVTHGDGLRTRGCAHARRLTWSAAAKAFWETVGPNGT